MFPLRFILLRLPTMNHFSIKIQAWQGVFYILIKNYANFVDQSVFSAEIIPNFGICSTNETHYVSKIILITSPYIIA